MKLSKVVLVWSTLWFLSLVPYEPINTAMDVIFVRLWHALSNWDMSYFTYVQEYDGVMVGTLVEPYSNPWLVLAFMVMTLALVAKNPRRLRTNRYLLLALRIASTIVCFNSTRGNLLAYPTRLEGLWMWLATLVCLSPFWLLEPHLEEEPEAIPA